MSRTNLWLDGCVSVGGGGEGSMSSMTWNFSASMSPPLRVFGCWKNT